MTSIFDVEDLIKESIPILKIKGPSKVYDRTGGEEQGKYDFFKLNVDKVDYKYSENDKIVMVGKTAKGDTLIYRKFSSEHSGNKPTLEIQKSKKDKIKFRYV